MVLFFILSLLQQNQVLCLTDDKSFGATYSEHKEPFIPEFSHKGDSYLLEDQNVTLSCTVNSCASTIRKDALENELRSGGNCSNATNIQPEIFDIMKLKIYFCNTNSRGSCSTEEAKNIDTRTILLTKLYLTIKDTGTYVCQYNGSVTAESTLSLTVGYKPVGPEDIRCISIDLKNLSCSWEKSGDDENNPLVVRYTSSFIASPRYGWFDCPQYQPLYSMFRDDRHCFLPSLHNSKNYSFNMNIDYILLINASNYGASKVIEYVVNPEEIAKLSSPILNVDVEDRQIVLVGKLSTYTKLALIVLQNIYYEVLVRSGDFNITKSQVSSAANTKLTVTNLTPFTAYKITVRIRGTKTKDPRYWSNPVTLLVKTKPAAPVAVPVIPVGGYSIREHHLIIYLKPIQRIQKNADDAYYSVAILTNKEHFKVNVSWDTSTLEVKGQSGSLVEIKTFNEIGWSTNATTVRIPHHRSDRPVPRNVIVERSGNIVSVSWLSDSLPDLDYITVYGCHGERMSLICKSDLNWTHVTKNCSNITFFGVEDKAGGEWLFAVSYQYKDGYSTGMVFPDCYFPSMTRVPDAVQTFNVVPISQTDIHIKPVVYCSPKYPSRPLQYIVFYKMDHRLTPCDGSFRNMTVNASFDMKLLRIRNLQSGSSYVVCLGVLTKGGIVISSPHSVQTLDNGKEFSHIIYIVFLSIILGFIVTCLLIFFVCKIKEMWSKQTEIILPKVKITKREHVQLEVCTDSGIASDDKNVEQRDPLIGSQHALLYTCTSIHSESDKEYQSFTTDTMDVCNRRSQSQTVTNCNNGEDEALLQITLHNSTIKFSGQMKNDTGLRTTENNSIHIIRNNHDVECLSSKTSYSAEMATSEYNQDLHSAMSKEVRQNSESLGSNAFDYRQDCSLAYVPESTIQTSVESYVQVDHNGKIGT